MFTEFRVHESMIYDSKSSIVVFSGRLRSPHCRWIPRLRYRRVLYDRLLSYSSGVTGRNEVMCTDIKDPFVTRFVHFFHNRLNYGEMNFVRNWYDKFYNKIVFKFLNKAK